MYSVLKNVLVFSVIILSFSGCLKKGQGDPAISLRTRKARVVGNWTMTSGSIVSSENILATGSKSAYNSTYTKDSYVLTIENYDSNGTYTTNTKTGSHEYTLEFKKNGDFSSTRIIDGASTVYTGTWNFTNGIGDKKNKTQIVLHYTSTGGSTAVFLSNSSGNLTNQTFDIKELRNKKMVLILENIQSTPGFSESSVKQEYVFEQ